MSVSDDTDAGLLDEGELTDDELGTLRWRFERLQRAGFDGEASLALALDAAVDLHLAEDLLRAGCPVETALRILG
jgi:hypothetical protein